MRKISLERYRQLFVYDLYFIQLNVPEVLAKIKYITENNGFIRYNVMGNLVRDVEIMKEILASDVVTSFMLH